MLQFLYDSMLIILSWQPKGGAWPNAPPKYAPRRKCSPKKRSSNFFQAIFKENPQNFFQAISERGQLKRGLPIFRNFWRFPTKL